MDIAEDIEKVMSELRKSVDANGNVNLLFMLREVVNLFERIKAVLPQTNVQERARFFTALHKLHAFLQTEAQRLSQKTGISEEQMSRYAENPDNFTKEQWSLLLEVKKKMGQQAIDMKAIMQKLEEQLVPAGSSTSLPPATEALEAPLKKKRVSSPRRKTQMKA